MLQISQIEKPRCSATIDQIRLRRAMAFPFEFQYFSSSGFQSEIQLVVLLIEEFPCLNGHNRGYLNRWCDAPCVFHLLYRTKNRSPRRRACASDSGVADVGPSLDPPAPSLPTSPSYALSNSSFVPDRAFFRSGNRISELPEFLNLPGGR